MIKTLKSNNQIVPMYPYGCWSDTPKKRVSSDRVYYGSGTRVVKVYSGGFLSGQYVGEHIEGADKPNWPHVMSFKCRYDNKHKDERCNGCQVEYDQEYVDSLK